MNKLSSIDFLNGCPAGFYTNLAKNKVVDILTASEYSENNAWNQNPLSGQLNNNNNKYNSYVVRPALALDNRRIYGWMSAYANCIKNKMTSERCTLYRLHEEDLLNLIEECEEHRYIPQTSTAFIVTKPKLREIFAANFRDRIVQHWVCQRIEPLFEERFKQHGDVTWNCRKERGVQKAVEALYEDILNVSDNYKQEAWVGRFDIRSFFMSIDIRILEKLVIAFVRKYYQKEDLDTLVYLLTVTIRHRPQDNCCKRGRKDLWNQLPKHKSLFYVERFRGMPIGNITSQLLANFYLSFLDSFMVRLCEPIEAKYERFVDDFAVVCRTKEDVLVLRDKAKTFLKEKLNLQMHEDKVYIQEVKKGVYFVGSVIKMNRVYIGNRTVGGIIDKLIELNAWLESLGNNFTIDDAYIIAHYASSLNSYFGFMANKKTYAIKRKTISKYCPNFFRYFYINGRFKSVKIKSRYTIKQFIKGEYQYE